MILIAIVMFIIVCALSTSDVIWPDDQYSDMNTLLGGENFATHGLFRLRFLPVWYIGPMTDPPSYYTHYPPLPYAMNGVMRILGINSLVAMRVLCGLMCVAGFLCMYMAFAPLLGSLATACGLAFIATTGYFFTYCVSVHQHTYNIFFMGIFFLCFIHGVHAEKPPRWTWAVCWLALMLESLTSFEFILWPQAFAWVYVLATGQIRRRWRELLFLATAPIAGVGLHFLQNCWAMGWSWASADAADAFRRPGRGQAQNRWEVLRNVPDFVLSNSQRLYFWPWQVLVLLAGIAVVLLRRGADKATRLAAPSALILALLAGSVTWYLFMPIHTVKHPHTMSQLLPLAMAVMGILIAIALKALVGSQSALHERILAGIAVLVILFGQTQSIAECFERADMQRPLSFYLFEAIGPQGLPDKVGVLTNTYADAQLAYYIRRPLWRCPEITLPFPEGIASLQKRLPPDWPVKYYLFDIRGDREAYQLLATTCQGWRISAGPRAQHFLILFDISPLHLPAEQHPKLPPDVLQKQITGDYPEWDKAGFRQRLGEVLRKHGKL